MIGVGREQRPVGARARDRRPVRSADEAERDHAAVRFGERRPGRLHGERAQRFVERQPLLRLPSAGQVFLLVLAA